MNRRRWASRQSNATYLEELDYPVALSVALLRELHRRTFGHLYDWAGHWRRTAPNAGAYLPPPAAQVPHPFTNGNGRTARLFTNLLAYNYGYHEIILYRREVGEARTHYLAAMRQANDYDLSGLQALISAQLHPLD